MTPLVRGRGPRERRHRLAVVRADGRLVAANGPGLGVRGRTRTDVPPTLWITAIHGELAPRPRDLAAALLLPRRTVVPSARVLAGRSAASFERDGVLEGLQAAQAAEHVAAEVLGLSPVLHGEGARVLAVDPAGACAGLLSAGDVVVAAAGRVVRTADDLRRATSDRTAAELLVLPVRHAGGASGPTAVRPARPGPLGLEVATHRPRLESGLDLDLHLDHDALGPSAGLLLALAVLDVLTPGSLSGGHQVAGTGTLALDGTVGPVAGVGLKAWAAAVGGVEVFLAPAAQAAEAVRAVRGVRRASVRVVPVHDVEDALSVLAELGGDPAELPVASRRSASEAPAEQCGSGEVPGRRARR